MEAVIQVSKPKRPRRATPPLPRLFTSAQWRRLAVKFGLTRRQQQVARLICQGHQQGQIAALLEVSPNTVRMHTRAIFAALQVHSRVGLTVRLVLAQRRSTSSRRGRSRGV